MWQSSALASPMKTLNTELVSNGDDIEPMKRQVKLSKWREGVRGRSASQSNGSDFLGQFFSRETRIGHDVRSAASAGASRSSACPGGRR